MPYKDKEKEKEYRRLYYKANKERLNQKSKERNLKNKDKNKAQAHKRYIEKHDEILKRRSEYYQENKERAFETQRRWVLNNKDKVKIIKARYREKNREKIRKDSIEYNKTHREQGLVNKRKWRARNPDKLKEEKLKARFGITLTQFNELLRIQDTKCGICGVAFDLSGDRNKNNPTVDHAHNETRKIRGLLCRSCNSGIGGLRDNPVLIEKATLWIKNSGPLKKEKKSIPIVSIPRERGYVLKRKFGITIKQYNNLLIAQGNKCGICDKELIKRVNVDHDHATQKIRGVLCASCNVSIGLLKENIKILEKAINWVKGDSNANS
jgi:hypothetical protein